MTISERKSSWKKNIKGKINLTADEEYCSTYSWYFALFRRQTEILLEIFFTVGILIATTGKGYSIFLSLIKPVRTQKIPRTTKLGFEASPNFLQRHENIKI